MTKERLKEILVILGVGTIALLGLTTYLQAPESQFVEPTPTATPTATVNPTTEPVAKETPKIPAHLNNYYEYLDLLKAYNAKIDYIKQNCDMDLRCLKVNGEAQVLFSGIKTEQDVIKKLNTWLQTEDAVFIK